jgi:hypothetical protein
MVLMIVFIGLWLIVRLISFRPDQTGRRDGREFDLNSALQPLADAQTDVSNTLSRQREEIQALRRQVDEWEETRLVVLDLRETIQGISASVAANPDEPDREWLQALVEDLVKVRDDLDGKLLPLIETQHALTQMLEEKQRQLDEIQVRMNELAEIRASVERLGSAFQAYTSAPPAVAQTRDLELVAAMEELRTQITELQEDRLNQDKAMRAVGAGLDDVNRIHRLLRDLERGLPSLLEKNNEAVGKAVRSDMAVKIGELEKVLLTMQDAVTSQQRDIASLTEQLEKGGVQTNVFYRVSMMDLPPGTPVGRTRLIPYEGMFVIYTNFPAAPVVDPFKQGHAALTPSAFSALAPEKIIHDPRVFSPVQSTLQPGDRAIMSPADMKLEY